ncbi:MAG: hypothetical protein H6739_01385 [Alphaproteobacteria bacterium]|nr:hypothetical protein [Alphaproteobacteria bacterium]
MRTLPALLLVGCGADTLASGRLLVHTTDAGLSITRDGLPLLDLTELSIGAGEAEIDFATGSYYFDEGDTAWLPAVEVDALNQRLDDVLIANLIDAQGYTMGALEVQPVGDDLLRVRMVTQLTGDAARVRARFACLGGESFLGGGGHAFDVDHAGERFPLWVSEPGIGKVDTDDYPDDWYLTGTRHATSFPQPFFLRPQTPVGVTVASGGRVVADLCASSELVWALEAWDDELDLLITAGDTPLEVVERHTLATGAPVVPPDWAFAPWNDAVRGSERVREVAAALREAGAPSSVIWTEDWKGAEQGALGYHLKGEWDLDTELYPDAAALAAELEASGFKWFAYFSPFLEPGTGAWSEAADFTIRDPETDEPYLFLSPTFSDISVLDLSRDDAWDWVEGKMDAVLDLGFDGWMADYAEWLPTDAVMQDMDPLGEHNLYPLLWQGLNQRVLEDQDAVAFSRSGWLGTQGLAPVTWAGDQRTSFDADDGLPTIVPMGIGLAVGGVAFYGHDIAGYQSVGNDPSDKELWFRWCTLGAFSPIMRTHHGAFASENWQFDSDAETLAHYARYAREHTRLFPYLRGLAAQAADTGRPLLLHPAFLFEDADWSAIDAWMLGEALYVAPVMTAGASGRDVALPSDVGWYDWWTGAPAQAGFAAAEMSEIPVFAASGSVVPLFVEAPDTLAGASAAGVTTLDDADGARLVRVFGPDGAFTEADGTTYTVSGAASAAGTATGTFDSGSLEVNGLTVSIDGPVARDYTIEVWP